MKVGVVRESAPDETRVALVPESVQRLRGLDVEVLVARGAGEGACFGDADYAQAGATLVDGAAIYHDADVVASVGPPAPDLPDRVHDGQVLIGLFAPALNADLVGSLATAGATVISLDGLPRTLSRAQAMDALTSQANVAGYRSVLVAAAAYPRFFPMLITAAGTVRPAEVLVLGAGVAGLQALGTARRLGATVRGYDVRADTREQVESVGATFVELDAVDAAGGGGYARQLDDDEQRTQQEQLAAHIARHDVLITTARVPGRRPPLLVTTEAIKAMRPGSVIVDLAASEHGGNVALSQPDATVRTDAGVTIIGASNLPATMAPAASTAYARNICAALASLIDHGALRIDLDDEIHAGIVVSHGGRLTAEVTR